MLKNITKTVALLSGIVISAIAFNASATSLKVGDKAPNFNLQATTGDFYNLKDFLGKTNVVLAWYPRANTHGCTIECKSLVEKGHLVRAFNATYFMASVDPLDANRDFAKKTNADFPMLSDPTKEVAEAYDVLHMLGFAKRITFYIGKNGTILKIDEDIKPATAAEDMAATLAELNIEKSGQAE
ncbi:peroxiredoxin [Colwellia sp. UCD-KL20]|uniref:peroxiredoxin n=1 Tax=Colwellia sp. UCD-KL20 TaxID=1917165 RepID=UPI000970C2C2|nr:peroxiredoxin [Colwellia sp. UCD-KL20]